MSNLALYGSALLVCLKPINLLLIFAMVALGIVFGAIPGLSATLGIALLLPVTFGLSTETSFVLLLAIWIGGVSGSFISAVLIGIPGSSSAIATCFDGYPMTLKGESNKALAIGITASFLGTLFSVLIATLVWDLMRTVDYLAQRAEWAYNEPGCLGFSGGGMQTLFLSTLEERISCAFVSGYFYGYRDSLLRQSWNCSCNMEAVPVEERRFGPDHYLRPNFVQFLCCERVLLRDVTLKNRPMWQLNPVLCRSVIVDGVTLSSHGSNNDGCGTGQLASGMGLQVFMTGRGTPYGLAAAPVIKVCSRSEMKEQWPDIIDYDAGPAALGKATIAEQGEEMFRYILDVASGRRQPYSEQYRWHNDICIFNPAPIT